MKDIIAALERHRLHILNIGCLLGRKFQASDFVRCEASTDAQNYAVAADVCKEIKEHTDNIYDWVLKAEKNFDEALTAIKSGKVLLVDAEGLRERLAIAIRNVNLYGKHDGHEYIEGSEKIADAIIKEIGGV